MTHLRSTLRCDEIRAESRRHSIEILLKEFEANTAEQRAIQDAQRKSTTVVPAALAIGVPLLLKTPDEVGGGQVIGYVLVGFGLLFLLLCFNYVGLAHAIYRLATHREHGIRPALLSLMASTNTAHVLGGERFIRDRFRRSMEYTLVLGSEFLMLLACSACCMALGTYFLSFSASSFIAFVSVAIYGIVLLPLMQVCLRIFRSTRPVRNTDDG